MCIALGNAPLAKVSLSHLQPPAAARHGSAMFQYFGKQRYLDVHRATPNYATRTMMYERLGLPHTLGKIAGNLIASYLLE